VEVGADWQSGRIVPAASRPLAADPEETQAAQSVTLAGASMVPHTLRSHASCSGERFGSKPVRAGRLKASA